MSVKLKVKVTPKASKNKIGKVHDGCLKIYVTAVPEKGKANCAVIDLVADALGIPAYDIEITSGTTSRVKELTIDGATQEDLNNIVEQKGEGK